LAASVKINGMKSRLAGGFPSINAFTIDLGTVSNPHFMIVTLSAA